MNTVTLKVAKVLKEADIEINTCWWWVSVRKGIPELYYEEALGLLECTSPYAYKRVAPAPTLGELMRELPLKVKVYRYYTDWEWRCVDEDEKRSLNTEVASTPEDAAGLMLLRVRKQK